VMLNWRHLKKVDVKVGNLVMANWTVWVQQYFQKK
jgi:hypothetical protein